MHPTRLATSVSDTDLFAYDPSPLEDERDPDNSRFPSNWLDLSKIDRSTITLSQPEPIPAFVLPHYNSVLQYDMKGDPLHYVKVCNQCGTVVPESYTFQHNAYHQELYDRWVAANVPRYIVSVDPATGTGTVATGGTFLRQNPDPSHGVPSPPPGNQQRTQQSLDDVCDNCTHKRRDHSITLGQKEYGRCTACDCTGFTIWPF